MRIARSSAQSFDSLLDRARLELGDALLDADLVDTADALDDRLDAVGATDPRAHERARLALGRDGLWRAFGYLCHVPILRPIVALTSISR